MSETPQERIVIRTEDLPAEAGLERRGLPPPDARVDPLARVSAVLGVASILFAGVAIGPVAMICGLVAALRTRGAGERGQTLALVGMVGGSVGTVLWTCILGWILAHHGGDARQSGLEAVRGPEGVVDRDAIERAPAPIRHALLANVSVLMERRSGATWGSVSLGSGTVVSVEGGRASILTCRHVVEAIPGGADVRLRVRWIDGRTTDARTEWMGEDSLDLAFLSTEPPAEGPDPTVAPLGATDQVQVGQPVFAVGNPLNYESSFVTGVVSAVRTIGHGDRALRVFQAQIPLNSGNSGGGLYTAAGELIGINSWTLPKSMVEGMGFSISLENLRAARQKLPAGLIPTFLGPHQDTVAPSAGP